MEEYHKKAVLFGLGALIPTSIPLFLLKNELRYLYIFILMGCILGIYVGFALITDNFQNLVVENIQFILFLVLLFVLYTVDPIYLSILFFAHVAWDLLHPHPLRTPIPEWYALTCVLYDISFGLLIIIVELTL